MLARHCMPAALFQWCFAGRPMVARHCMLARLYQPIVAKTPSQYWHVLGSSYPPSHCKQVYEQGSGTQSPIIFQVESYDVGPLVQPPKMGWSC